ncbi:carbamoyl-phosphate synthase, partial [Cyanobium sp. HWJ4-Hawea]|nr:carbamoyl-phosphate synthase [Cyanobium sp. HWJ4-Hawea]
DLKYRFGSNGYGAPSSKKQWKTPVIQALTETVKHRDVRVHDKATYNQPHPETTPVARRSN